MALWWLPARDHVLISKDPVSFLLDMECGRTCALDPCVPNCGSLGKTDPVSPRDLRTFVPHAHCHVSNGLLMAIMTGSTPNRQTPVGSLALSWGRQPSTWTHLLRKRKQHGAVVWKAEARHLELATSKPFTDHTTVFSCLPFALPSLPSTVCPLRENTKGGGSLVLLGPPCPSETMALSNKQGVGPVAMSSPFGIP